MTASCGSSPLTRGKPRTRHPEHVPGGLIPAHAGKTVRSGTRRRRAGAHPRSRGENHSSAPGPDRVGGSSPLTRGKLAGVGARPALERLIPAHAGKTVIIAVATSSARAHPRSRGENITERQDRDMRDGSSPLTRGKRW